MELIKNELESSDEKVQDITSKILTNEPVEVNSEKFSSELKTIIQNESKGKITNAVTRAVESIFAAKWTYKRLNQMKKKGIKIILDGNTIDRILVEDQWKIYKKTGIPNDPNEEELAVCWFVKEWCIEANNMVSKLDIYDEIINRFKESGRKSSDIPPKKIIMNQINYIFNDPETFKHVRNLCHEMGLANENVIFEKSQIDEVGWYMKGKYHARRIMYERKISNILLLWTEIEKDNPIKCFRKDFDGNILQREIEDLVFQASKTTKNEIIRKVWDIADIEEDINIENQLHIKCLKNGYYNTKKFKFLKEVNPEEDLVTMELPVKYDPKARCSSWAKYISNAVNTPEEIIGIWETITWCIINDLKLDKAIFFIGAKAQNGKSTLIDKITEFIGQFNVSNVSLEAMATNRFATYGLIGKIVNMYADINNQMITHLKEFRSVVTRDRISVEGKGKDAINFRPSVVNIWSVNDPPELEEKGDNTYRRIYPIEFPNKFVPNPTEDEIKRGFRKIDYKLVERMSSESERSGVFNLCIRIAKKLRMTKTFTNAPSTDEVRDFWEDASNHLIGFSKSYLRPIEGAYILVKDMEFWYRKFCQGKQRTPLTRNKFIDRFPKECPFDVRHQKVSRDDGRWCWKDIWWNFKALPTTDDGKPMFDCELCFSGNHHNCSDQRCLCHSKNHNTKQETLPTTDDGKPKLNCQECIARNHHNCSDETNCLCASENHETT